MCEPCEGDRRAGRIGRPTLKRGPGPDPAQDIALVARAKRELLLRANRYRLGREDLEDCYSQATLELVAQVREGVVFADRRHLGNTLELRFLSRVRDRRRALAGRSPIQAALHDAIRLEGEGKDEFAFIDRHADVEKLVLLRHDLRRIQLLVRELTPDQQLVLAHELGSESSLEQAVRCFGWSPEKYRKVSCRARARLKRLLALDEQGAA